MGYTTGDLSPTKYRTNGFAHWCGSCPSHGNLVKACVPYQLFLDFAYLFLEKKQELGTWESSNFNLILLILWTCGCWALFRLGVSETQNHDAIQIFIGINETGVSQNKGQSSCVTLVDDYVSSDFLMLLLSRRIGRSMLLPCYEGWWYHNSLACGNRLICIPMKHMCHD